METSSPTFGNSGEVLMLSWFLGLFGIGNRFYCWFFFTAKRQCLQCTGCRREMCHPPDTCSDKASHRSRRAALGTAFSFASHHTLDIPVLVELDERAAA